MNDVAQGFSDLFEGRKDAYGSNSGGCIRVYANSEWEPYLWEKHLTGEQPIGVYPLVEDRERPDGSGISHSYGWRVKWGCWDGDIKTADKPAGDYESEDDAHVAAVNLQRVLARLGCTGWIERTRNKGRHVWIFADTWVPAKVMRRALLVACQVAGVSTREVNPKQESLNEGQVGSYVRLPYAGMLSRDDLTDTQVIIQEQGYRFRLDEFVGGALALRASLETLESIAAKYKEPSRLKAVPEAWWRDVHDHHQLLMKLGPLSRHYLASGNTADRSKLLEAFVRSAKDDGLSPSETLVLADELAAKTGKFEGRVDRERQLRVIVERAWK